jgi:hypothetical protein
MEKIQNRAGPQASCLDFLLTGQPGTRPHPTHNTASHPMETALTAEGRGSPVAVSRRHRPTWTEAYPYAGA